MDDNQDESQVLETETTEVADTTELTAEQIAELKQKAAKADELEGKNKQLFERAKKAEDAAKATVHSQDTGLSQTDIIFLAKADIHEDDIGEVTELAKLKKIPVSEAYKYLKPVLNERAEERKTAAATQTKGGARGTAKVTGEDMLRKVEATGELPDDPDALMQIAEARLARKRVNAK